MKLLDETAKGVFVVSTTPFADDGALDFDSLDRQIDFYLACGIDGMSILGLVGEASMLSLDESLAVCQRVLKRTAGRVPVIANVARPDMAALKRLAETAMEFGAAGVMIAPGGRAGTDEQVAADMHAVLAALAPIPVVLLAAPQSSAARMPTQLINRLISEFSHLKMLKHEDWPGLRKLSDLRAAEARGERRRISILSGNKGMLLPMELARGADGVITGTAYPEALVAMYDRFVAHDVEGAEDIYDALLPLMRYEAQPGAGLVIRKCVLQRRGITQSAAVRIRRSPVGTQEIREIVSLMARVERNLRRLGIDPVLGHAGPSAPRLSQSSRPTVVETIPST